MRGDEIYLWHIDILGSLYIDGHEWGKFHGTI